MTSPNGAAAPIGRMLTAMATPMTADGQIDHDDLAALAVRLVDDGHDGLVVSGTTGEAPTTTDAEKTQILRTVIDAVGDRACIVAGVGTNITDHTVHLAKAAEQAGADALLVVTPYYNKPPQEGLVAHFTAVADATELPNVLYDIPGRAGVPIHPATLQRLGEHDRIVGVKDAKGDFFSAAEVMATTNLVYYSGEDALNLAWLASGAVGLISVVGHAFGPEYVRMIAAVDRGDLGEARAINASLIPAVKLIMSAMSQGAIQSKAAMQLMGVIRSRHLRLPLLEASEGELGFLRETLIAAGKKVTV
ncbi:4-hydroxy-tetrahydrodipicolinate synthase [Cumulibacter soli]|uniref:4-hydroxy-tetrahydrodipicolinate synthase n=1 Tax=Cumulibacter soli TaxID=2546344 RepID=UPI001067E311|nr:4-hydroxy-tetrahydrodipicolinate synthase [Cumulibacter soli]